MGALALGCFAPACVRRTMFSFSGRGDTCKDTSEEVQGEKVFHVPPSPMRHVPVTETSKAQQSPPKAGGSN